MNIFELNLHLSYIKLHENRNNLSNIKIKLTEAAKRLWKPQTHSICFNNVEMGYANPVRNSSG